MSNTTERIPSWLIEVLESLTPCFAYAINEVVLIACMVKTFGLDCICFMAISTNVSQKGGMIL